MVSVAVRIAALPLQRLFTAVTRLNLQAQVRWAEQDIRHLTLDLENLPRHIAAKEKDTQELRVRLALLNK